MELEMLKAKLHHARVTHVALEYEGSITIDKALMDAVGIRPYEKVLVANLENGERFETYTLAAESGSGTICLNGATAHKGREGDRLIIFAFCRLSQEEAERHVPAILRLDAANRPVT